MDSGCSMYFFVRLCEFFVIIKKAMCIILVQRPGVSTSVPKKLYVIGICIFLCTMQIATSNIFINIYIFMTIFTFSTFHANSQRVTSVTLVFEENCFQMDKTDKREIFTPIWTDDALFTQLN